MDEVQREINFIDGLRISLSKQDNKEAINIFSRRMNVDSEFNKKFYNLILRATQAHTFKEEFGINELSEGITDSLYRYNAVSQSYRFKHPVYEYRDIVTSFYLYLRQLRKDEQLTARNYVHANKLLDELKEPFGNTLYSYIVNILDYYWDKKI